MAKKSKRQKDERKEELGLLCKVAYIVVCKTFCLSTNQG